MSSKWWLVLAASGLLAFGAAACGDDDDDDGGGSSDLSGSIRIDGSSTLAPLTEAVAEKFNEENSGVDVTVGTSGTGGGFEKFCAGETDANDASEAIDEETVAICQKNGVEYAELQVANDALTVVANPNNPVTCLTVDQLKSVWEKGSTLKNWSEIQGLDPAFDSELALYGPGSDSGTFSFFTEAINGEEDAQRTDYNDVGEDDNATVTGVAGADGGMGYFGYSFFVENEGTIKALEIDGGGGCVAPSEETVQDSTYTPLARPLFIYPSADALARPEFDAFLQYYVDNVNDIASQVGFIGLTDEQLSESKTELEGLIGTGGGAAGGADTTGGAETTG
ncbi:MAG: PstS family phosphate ABC transporter substrate-binding protein [Actinomycetota bacterium]|nr:PstS family phosphate ABC transporter substrate-binding protein [Actinomycetota bacterium]